MLSREGIKIRFLRSFKLSVSVNLNQFPTAFQSSSKSACKAINPIISENRNVITHTLKNLHAGFSFLISGKKQILKFQCIVYLIVGNFTCKRVFGKFLYLFISKLYPFSSSSHLTEAETKTETDTDTETKADTETDTLCDARGAGEGRASSTRYILETSEIIDYLNQKAGSRYQPTAKSTERLIAALLNDGYTVEDMKQVVDMKCKEWKFTEYQKYLRPETLFGEKFEGYLNTPQAPTLPKRQSNSAWYDPSYAATIERYKNTSLFDD